MKILLINKFLYRRGGDAVVTLDTGKLLQNRNHDVYYWGMKNSQNENYPYDEYFVNDLDYAEEKNFNKAIAALNILYSFEAYYKLKSYLSKIGTPDIVHLHNFAHHISPSILFLLHAMRIPAIMTLHDYKLICPIYTLYRNNKPCELCRSGHFYNCLLNKCTKNSISKSFVNICEMYLHHYLLRPYMLVSEFISPSKFLREKHYSMGFNKRMTYLPNFIDSVEIRPEFSYSERCCVYFGRLSKEKGLYCLINAMKNVAIKLKIFGDGPLFNQLQSYIISNNFHNVELLGYLDRDRLRSEIKKSMFSIVPSLWYENNPRSIIESFALGKPVIGSRIGGIPELVIDGVTGFTFEPGNSLDLKLKIDKLSSDPGLIYTMGRNGREFVSKELAPEKHYSSLLEIYNEAINKYKN